MRTAKVGKHSVRRHNVRLNVDVCAGDLVDKARLADVGKTRNEQRARVWVDRRQTRQVLTDLLKVREGRRLSPHDGAHAAECCALELLAPVHRVAVLEKAHVVLGHAVM
jgi:hypothetical protein